MTRQPVNTAARGSALERARAWWARNDDAAYSIVAATCTLVVAGRFYGAMHRETGGSWSAPLDDVFIHFDFARSFARGYPMQWSEGNGYSSGNTSLTYPVILALGYWLGFRDLSLMVWAAALACASVFAFLLWSRHLADPCSDGACRWAKFLLPPTVLSMGALDWTLLSGMENAWHLALWGLTASVALGWAPSSRRARTGLVGLLGALLVATRPESVVCVAAFGVFCARRELRAGPRRTAVVTLLAIAAPSVLLLAVQAVANRAWTGEWVANGAIAKLFIHNPFLSGTEKWARYRELLGYIASRLTQHHFADEPPWGWLVPAVAILPLFARRTRPVAVLLWAHVLAWILVIALNSQLRWQNERYAMPAVAWLLLLAALGLAVLASRDVPAGPLGPGSSSERLAWPRWIWRRAWPARVLVAGLVVVVYWAHQAPNMKDQIWFFGRASRNILDQHVTAGRLIARSPARRVLVGDAGALMYASDRPGLDLIGLGGYHDLPFARSTLHGLGASLELIERIVPEDRPDLMAIYPSWWGDLPILFGRYLTAVPAPGNVICGGAEKVLYRADWSALDLGGAPRTLGEDERVVDELDGADLVSESAHAYRISSPPLGFVQYHVLADPTPQRRDLFDAGRLVPPGKAERARLRAPLRPGRLIVRMAPERATCLEIVTEGTAQPDLCVSPRWNHWQEPTVALPPGLPERFELELRPRDGPSVQYHVWVVEQRPGRD